LSGHNSWVLDVSFNPNGGEFASSSSDATVKIWDARTSECLHSFEKAHDDQVLCGCVGVCVWLCVCVCVLCVDVCVVCV